MTKSENTVSRNSKVFPNLRKSVVVVLHLVEERGV